MASRYSPEDVARWEGTFPNSLAIHTEKLKRDDASPDHRRFHLGMLSLTYRDMATTAIARGAFADAIRLLRLGVDTVCRLHELFEQGFPGEGADAGHFQSVLLAFATRDTELSKKMVSHYRFDKGIKASVFLGKIIKSIAHGDHAAAQDTLSKPWPKVEAMFRGYPECLQAIANKDEPAFRQAIPSTSKNWAKWAARVEKGLPGAVCFIQGIGLVRLAEHAMGRHIPISDDNMPPELLSPELFLLSHCQPAP